jgi:hypothetical protein
MAPAHDRNQKVEAIKKFMQDLEDVGGVFIIRDYLSERGVHEPSPSFPQAGKCSASNMPE